VFKEIVKAIRKGFGKTTTARKITFRTAHKKPQEIGGLLQASLAQEGGDWDKGRPVGEYCLRHRENGGVEL
jgi:hypothetical protein